MDYLLWPGRALAFTYRTLIRPLLPVTRPALYADMISSFDYRMGDAVLPRRFRPSTVDDIEGYEEQLIASLRAHVRSGFDVVIVGGGTGITAAAAAKLVGDGGSVTCYEASSAQLAAIRACCRRNDIAHRVDLRFATVGIPAHVYGRRKSRNGPLTHARDLPGCDVLELDCEGAERVVLAEMTIRPGVIIVETHGQYGSPTGQVFNQLVRMGYAVTDLGVAESRYAKACLDRDMHVLVAQREQRRLDASVPEPHDLAALQS